MDGNDTSRGVAGRVLSGVREQSDGNSKPAVEPESWQDLSEFVDQFNDAVFGVLAATEDGTEGFWIAEEIAKIRPAAVPIGDPPTFDLSVLGPSGKVVDEVQLTIEEIEHVRAAELSGVLEEAESRR